MSIDLNAFNKFFIDYQQRFVHFACTYVHDEAVAEDFVVESMMYYWENKDRLSADTNIPAYVLTTIKHKCIDYLRHQQVYQDASDEIARIYAWELSGRIMTLEDFEPYEVFTKEIQEIVDRTLDALPEQTRKIFVMSRNENKYYNQGSGISYIESYQDVTSCIEGLSAGILTFFLFALKKTVFH